MQPCKSKGLKWPSLCFSGGLLRLQCGILAMTRSGRNTDNMLVLTDSLHISEANTTWFSTISQTEMSPKHLPSPSTETCIEKHHLQCKNHPYPSPICVWPKELSQTHNQHLYLPPCNCPQHLVPVNMQQLLTGRLKETERSVVIVNMQCQLT